MTEELLPEELPNWLERLQQRLNQLVLRKKWRGWGKKVSLWDEDEWEKPKWSERPSSDKREDLKKCEYEKNVEKSG